MKNGCNTSESLCATCDRCRALPDPAGCAFHRRHWQTRELEGHPYSRAREVSRGQGDTAIVVLECPDYAGSGKPAGKDGQRCYLSVQDDARIYEMRELGLEWTEISRRTNVPTSTAHRAWERHKKRLTGQKPARRAPNQKLSPQKEWQIYKLRQEGWSYESIARQVGLSRTTVREACYRMEKKAQALLC